ncbi:MAG TPA: transporter [Tepidisphaeraceae bacterium]|nr:transporter [Tepidisphaeraceae bacterium]
MIKSPNVKLLAAIALLAGFIAADSLAALADATQPATQPSPPATSASPAQPPDKWQFTLFNPTPTNQLRTMDTDRPNITNTPHTIDAGHVQIETGFVDYAYYRDDSHGVNLRQDDFDFGQFNFRLGVLNDLELNAVINAYDLAETHDYLADTNFRAGSFGDTVIGGKLNIFGDDGDGSPWSSALAIQPQFKIPTARDNVGNGKFEFLVQAPYYLYLPAGFGHGLQPGISHERNDLSDGYTTGFPASICLDRVVISNLDVYLEFACDPTTQTHTETDQTIDVGGTYPLNDNVVLDTGVNFGLNRASTTVEVLAGISVRF